VIFWCTTAANLVHKNDSGGVASICNGREVTVELSRGEIMAQQISPDTVSICVQAIDLESGIKLISTGIGSVLDGLEIQSLWSVSITVTTYQYSIHNT
jgi:hypothetical protein